MAMKNFVSGAADAGAVDYVVTAYRANPDLLAALLRDADTAEQTTFILGRASDEEFASSIGVDILASVDPLSTLSVRETEVHELLCQGLQNAEIARRLYISPATVKIHVRHIYDKLGIRSRTALVFNAADRMNQANPTAVTDGPASSSGTDG
jgi:DNA-binding NarL/FixJ family response regulator